MFVYNNKMNMIGSTSIRHGAKNTVHLNSQRRRRLPFGFGVRTMKAPEDGTTKEEEENSYDIYGSIETLLSFNHSILSRIFVR